MTDLAKLRAANARRWERMAVRPERTGAIDAAARRLVAPAAKARYAAVSARTGVPWFVIAVIHEREATQSWRANIAQGDPWDEVSRHVPAGRGPFASWEDAAVDALTRCAPHAARNKDWSAGGALTILEAYNGFGYEARGIPSPYLWAGTDQYVSGKYVADHDYRPDVIDRQIGCAALLERMMALDPSIAFGGQGAAGDAPTPMGPPASPRTAPPPKPASSSAGKATGGAAAGAAAAAAAGAAAAAHEAGLSTGTVLVVAVLVAIAVLAVILVRRK